MSTFTSESGSKTQSLQCWPKLKALRRQAAIDVWNAPKEGRPVAIGLNTFAPSIAGAFNAATFSLGPNLGKVLEDIRLLTRYNELAEEKGFGPDCCGIGRIHVAMMHQGTHNVNPATGEAIQPDFGLDLYSCGEQGKLQREFCEHYGVPSFDVEIPTVTGREEYFTAQMLDILEAIEKKVGLQCDDERFIACVTNEWRSKVLFAKLCDLQKHRPAPLDMKTLIWIVTLLQNAKAYNPEVVSALGEVLAEVQAWVANGLSAMEVEKARLQFDGQQPWYTYGDFGSGFMWRCATEYGAVGVGSYGNMTLNGAWDTAEDGTLAPTLNLEERGVVLKTREEAARSLADLYLNHRSPIRRPNDLEFSNRAMVKYAKDWQIDAVIMNLDRSCHPATMGALERKLALQEAGVRCMVYEAPYLDPREINMAEIGSRLETFMETLGLRKL